MMKKIKEYLFQELVYLRLPRIPGIFGLLDVSSRKEAAE